LSLWKKYGVEPQQGDLSSVQTVVDADTLWQPLTVVAQEHAVYKRVEGPFRPTRTTLTS